MLLSEFECPRTILIKQQQQQQHIFFIKKLKKKITLDMVPSTLDMEPSTLDEKIDSILTGHFWMPTLSNIL